MTPSNKVLRLIEGTLLQDYSFVARVLKGMYRRSLKHRPIHCWDTYGYTQESVSVHKG